MKNPIRGISHSPLTSRTGLSIRSRTIIGYVFIAAITILACILALVHIQSAARSIELINRGSSRMQELAALQISWDGMMSSIDMMLLTRQSSQVDQRVRNSIEDLSSHLDSLSAIYAYEDREYVLRDLVGYIGMAVSTVDSIGNAASDGRWATAQIIHHRDLSSIQRRIDEELHFIRENTALQVISITEAASEMQNKMRTGLIAILILVALLGPLAAVMTASSIVRPIEYLASAVRSLKPEGLARSLEVTRSDEIGELAVAYNSMTERLHQIMNGLEDQVEAHRQMQEALRESEDRYRSLFQHSPISLWQLSLAEYPETSGSELEEKTRSSAELHRMISIIDVNRATLELLSAKSKDELENLGSILTPNAREVFDEAFQRFSTGETSFRSETTLSDLKGSLRYVIAHFAVPPDNENGSRRVFLSLLDITARKKMERALKESEEQYYHSQKMEAVGRLTGGIAHDFNNLLTVIINNCDIALMENDLAPNASSHLNQISSAARRAANVTEQLLAFSRQQVSNPVELNINGLIEEAAGMLGHIIGENIDISLDLQPDLPPVIADPGQMDQVILNLAVNAKDAMPRGGSLSFATSAVYLTEAESRSKPEVSPGMYIRMSVTDNGYGMAKEVLERAFDPFFTTKEQGKGTGLGLASVHGIVTNNKGWIDVASSPGEGTTFNIHIPRGEGEPGELQDINPVEIMDPGTETVLLVEDEDGVREIASKALRLNGYTVIEAEDSISAFEAFRNHSEEIDILISDVVLPGRINGIDIAKVMRTRKPGISVLLMSGYIQEAITRSGDLPDNSVFLSKPFSLTELHKKIREALNMNQLNKETPSSKETE